MSAKPMLTANLNALRLRHPVVLERILSVGTKKPDFFEYDDAGAEPILKTIRGEHSFPAYGPGKKINVIKRWFDGLIVAPESLYALPGFGDGSHARHFLEESASGTNFIVAEKDPALLRETFARFDCTDLLNDDRFILGTGDLDDAFFAGIQGAALSAIQDINMLVFSPLHSIDEAYYDRMRNELIRQYLVIRPLMEVNLRTATTIQSNTFRNLPFMANSPDVGELKDQFPELPFILVGAGPSLDESIEFLQMSQSRAIIVCSNSSLRKLINSGIKPHIVVTADPQSPTFEGFRGVDVSNLILACPFSAYPGIVELFEGRILSWCTFNPIVDILKRGLGLPNGTPIMEQGTVSGCVLDLSRLLGCKKVIFVGQDMAIREDGRYYTDDSSYSDHGGHFTNITKGHKLPGNTQDEVLVEGRLYVYLKTFEQFIAKQSGVEYVNLARTGVRIEGTTFMSYEDASDWVGDGSNANFVERVDELLSKKSSEVVLSEIYSDAKQFIEEIMSKSLTAAIETEMLPEKYSGMNYSENKVLLDLLRVADNVNKLVDENNLFWLFLFEGKTKNELVHYRRVIRDIKFPSKNWSAVQRNKEYFWALSEGCNWLLGELQKHNYFQTQKENVLS